MSGDVPLHLRRLGDSDRAFLGYAAADAIDSRDPARIRRDRPPCPPETCPQVDSLSTLLDAISGDLETVKEECSAATRNKLAQGLVDQLVDISASLASARLRLEELRSANDQLRRSSYYWRRAFDGAAK